MQDVNILRGVKIMMTNQTDSQAIVKGGRLGIVPRGGAGKLHAVLPIGSITGADSYEQVLSLDDVGE